MALLPSFARSVHFGLSESAYLNQQTTPIYADF